MAERVVTIGGGNGSPVVNEALLRTNEVDFIEAISAVFDTGGATGRRRVDSRGQELAYSDAMRNVLSLSDPTKRDSPEYKALQKMMTNRSWGKVLGQEYFAHFHKDGDGFDEILDELSKLTGLKFMGTVIPSTTSSTNIIFSTNSGRIYTGEDQLDSHSMSKDMVVNMWLEKAVPAYKNAMDAIQNASLIILSCGSLHGSVLCNTLPIGMREAFQRTHARLFLVTNLVSSRNETNQFTPVNFVKLIEKYTGIRPTGLIVPEMSRRSFEETHKEVAFLYDLEHSHFLGWEGSELEKFSTSERVEIITHNAVTIRETSANEKVVRHDPGRLADTLKSLL